MSAERIPPDWRNPGQWSVREIWRYPVKSLGGERVSEAALGPDGIEGDRVCGILDLGTGLVLTARRAPELLFASASMVEGDVVITLPDGTETVDDATLSGWLKRDVGLIRPGAEGGRYENPANAEEETDWTTWQGPAGSFHDSTKSKVSLVSMARLAGRDVRRFRTNIVLGHDSTGHITEATEDDLVGQAVGLGSQAIIDVRKQINRCVMVSRPQPGLAADLDVLREINRSGGLLSVGALIIEAGSFGLGDRLS